MAAPRQAITRFDLSISYQEFSTRANRKKMIAMRVLTPLAVAKQSAQFLRVKVASVLTKVEDTRRAPKASYKRDDFQWDTDHYATEEHGVEEPLDDRLLAVYGAEIRAEAIHADRAVNRVLMALEDAAAKAVFDTTVWTGAALTTAVSTPWSDRDNCAPIDDVDNAVEKVKLSCGQEPNVLICSDWTLKKLKRSKQVTDRLKYSGYDDVKNISNAAIAELLELEEILVGRGFANTADEGQEATFSRFWPVDMAMVGHVNASQDLEDPEPTIGHTLMYSEEVAAIPGVDDPEMSVIVEEYREEGRRGSVIRARHDRQLKIWHPEAAHLLTNVCAEVA